MVPSTFFPAMVWTRSPLRTPLTRAAPVTPLITIEPSAMEIPNGFFEHMNRFKTQSCFCAPRGVLLSAAGAAGLTFSRVYSTRICFPARAPGGKLSLITPPSGVETLMTLPGATLAGTTNFRNLRLLLASVLAASRVPAPLPSAGASRERDRALRDFFFAFLSFERRVEHSMRNSEPSPCPFGTRTRRVLPNGVLT